MIWGDTGGGEARINGRWEYLSGFAGEEVAAAQTKWRDARAQRRVFDSGSFTSFVPN